MSNPTEGMVVNFTNISDSDFTHAWGGVPYFVPAKATLPFPYHLGHHLATHLARKMLLANDKGATMYDPRDTSAANGNGTILWNEETEKAMVLKMLGETFTHEVPKPKTELELLREQVEKLHQQFGQGKDAIAPINPDGFKDKGQIIDEMKKLGLPVDARKSKETLETQLEAAKKATP